MPIFSSDDSAASWRKYLTSQISHVAVGVFLTWGSTVLSLVGTGEFPYKAHIFISLAALYALFELTFQGWNGWDTVEDWTFFSLYGVAGTILTFHEYDVGTGLATFDITAPTVIFPVIIAHLSLGCAYRKWGA